MEGIDVKIIQVLATVMESELRNNIQVTNKIDFCLDKKQVVIITIKRG